MKAAMIVAALLSSVSALPANGSAAGTPEVSKIDNAGIQQVASTVKDLTSKTRASIKLVQNGNAKSADVIPQIKQNFGQLESALTSLNRVEGVSAIYGATKAGANGAKGGIGGGKGGKGGKGGLGGPLSGIFYTEGDYAFDIEQFGDGIFSLGDIIGALLNLVIDVVDLDGIVEGAADAVTELLNDVADEPDTNNNLLPLRAGAVPALAPGVGPIGGGIPTHDVEISRRSLLSGVIGAMPFAGERA